MAVEYPIPSHCELAVVLERAIMLVFAPITLPFKYKTTVQDADDFWVQYCADCTLRGSICRVSGALSNGSCKLGHKANSRVVTNTVQMPVPRHVLFFGMYEDSLRFAYERADGVLTAMLLSNIYSDGTWCSGGVSYNHRDPTSIYSGYFNSIHNHDLSPSDYPQFIEGLVNGTRSMDYDNSTFDPEDRWGDTKNIVANPSKIEWATTATTDFLRIGRGNYYAKVS